jgi:hypothetical protein
MQYQLRIYKVKPGRMDEFVREWRETMLPLRAKFGFRADSAWRSTDDATFTWVVGYDGDREFDDVDREYTTSPERQSVDPNPGRHLESWHAERITEVEY